MSVIETVALTKRFRRCEAVSALDLKLEEHSVFALMGPNGAGKTTFIKLLMNLISPTLGHAIVLGQDSEQLRGSALAKIGYVSENQRLPEWMTAEGFLSYLRPFYPSWDRGFEGKLVQRFELPRKQKLKQLSRGMKMKVALASALAFHPKLIILDEPLSGLDPVVRDDLMESLSELTGETTVLFSSHDLAEIESFSSHVGYMDHGRLLLCEPMARVRERFRAVEIQSDTPLRVPERMPAEWRRFSADQCSARWIESDFDIKESMAAATEVFGAVRIESSALPLREVFLSMARGGRNVGPNEGEK
jgi:ABC-2 type transport system ATP-binding protein